MYRQHGIREMDTPYGHAIASDYYDYETPTGDQRYPEFHAVTHDETSPDSRHLRADKDHDQALLNPHHRQFGYLVHDKPRYVHDHEDPEMLEHLARAHREREAMVGHYEGYHHDEDLHHEDMGYAVEHLEVPMMHHEVDQHHYPVEEYHHEVYHHEPEFHHL